MLSTLETDAPTRRIGKNLSQYSTLDTTGTVYLFYSLTGHIQITEFLSRQTYFFARFEMIVFIFTFLIGLPVSCFAKNAHFRW